MNRAGQNSVHQEGNAASVVCAVALASPILSFQVGYAALGILYLAFIHQKLVLNRQFSRDLHSTGLMAFLVITAAFMIYHFNSFTENSDYQRSIELLLIFPLLIMVHHSAQYLTRNGTVDPFRVAAYVIWLSLAFMLARIVYLLINGEIVQLGDLVVIRPGNRNNFYDLNPNHVDNIFIYTILILAWSLSVLAFARRLSWKMLVPAGLMIIACGFYFYSAKSYAGYVSLAIAVAMVPAINIAVQNRMLGLVTVGVAAAIAVVLAVFVLSAVSVDVTTVAKTVASPDKLWELHQTVCGKFAKWGQPVFESAPEIPRSLAHRLVLGIDAIQLWQYKPLLGHGAYDPVEFAARYDELADCSIVYFSHVHSFYLDILIRGGLMLLLLYLVFAVFALWAVFWKRPGRTNIGATIVFAPLQIYVVYLLVDNLSDLGFIHADALTAVILTLPWIYELSGSAVESRQED